MSSQTLHNYKIGDKVSITDEAAKKVGAFHGLTGEITEVEEELVNVTFDRNIQEHPYLEWWPQQQFHYSFVRLNLSDKQKEPLHKWLKT